MADWFDLIHSGLLHQPDANEEAKRFLDQKAAENAAAVTGGAAPPAAQPPIGAAQPGPGEPQAYQTPKSWGSILMDLSRQNQQEQQFNRSLGGIFGTLSQPINRERVSHTFDTQQMDPLQFGKTAMDLSSQQQGQDRVNQIAKIVNDPVQGPALAQKMGLDWGVLKAGILTDPSMLGRVATVMATPTTGQRDLAAAQAAIEKQVRLEHPDWTDAQVQAEVNRQAPPSMLLSGVGNLDDQAYRRYAADEQAAGRTPLDPIAWKEHTKNVTENKDVAVQEYPGLDMKLTRSEQTVNKLLADLDHTMSAINLPGWLTSGTYAANAPSFLTADQRTKDQAGQLATLLAELKGEGLRNVKNVRNVQEFNVLGDALTAALKPGNSKAAVEAALNDLKLKFAQTRAIARQQAGMPAEETQKGGGGGGGGGVKRRKYNDQGELVD